jgi:hypothetical protein
MQLHLVRCLLWAGSAATILGGAPAAAQWHFEVPAGWVDLTTGHAAPRDLPPDLIEAAAHSQACAVDPASAGEGYRERMEAQIIPVAMVVDERALAPYISGYSKGLHRTDPAARLEIVEQGIVQVQGVPAIRIVADLSESKRHLRVLQYLIPGADSSASIAYFADPHAYGRYLPLFEANVRKIQGAAQPAASARLRNWLRETWLGQLDASEIQGFFQILGTVIGISVFVAFAAARRKRQASRAAR